MLGNGFAANDPHVAIGILEPGRDHRHGCWLGKSTQRLQQANACLGDLFFLQSQHQILDRLFLLGSRHLGHFFTSSCSFLSRSIGDSTTGPT